MKMIKLLLIGGVIIFAVICVINQSGVRTVHTSVEQRGGMPYEVSRAEWHADKLWAYLEDQWYRAKRVFRRNLRSMRSTVHEKVRFGE